MLINRINQQWLKKFIGYCLPHICIGCHLPSHTPYSLCRHCNDLLPWLENACQRCALPLSPIEQSSICGRCLRHPPLFHRSHILFQYLPPISAYILSLKLSHQAQYAYLFGQLLAEKIKSTWYLEKSLPEVIMPVPLHPQRLRHRGYNQAIEIAKPIARSLHIPLDRRHCQRIKPTLAQAEIDAVQRQSNVKGAFSLRTKTTYKHVAIVDDVLTTGHTLNELSRLLIQAGVEKIEVWCVARTMTKFIGK